MSRKTGLLPCALTGLEDMLVVPGIRPAGTEAILREMAEALGS